MSDKLQGDIKLLAELQFFDSVIQRLKKEKDTVPSEIMKLRGQAEEIQKEIAESEKALEELQSERRKKEREIDDKIEVLNKYRAQKNQVKTNVAYSALLKEIQDVEGEKSELEEEILIFMEHMDGLSCMLTEKKIVVTKYREELAHLEEKNKRRVAELEREILMHLDRRNSTAVKVAADLFSRYEKVRQAKGGLAFVDVKSNACQGCFMELPPQVISELMEGKIRTCERCSRLLYWKGE